MTIVLLQHKGVAKYLVREPQLTGDTEFAEQQVATHSPRHHGTGNRYTAHHWHHWQVVVVGRGAFNQLILKFLILIDNPLNCSCELVWFPKLLEDLKNKDDEMSQKKKPLCHMSLDNREYFVQAMPIEKMHCAGLNVSPSPTSGGLMRILQVNILAQIAMFSLAFLSSV